MVHLMAEMTEYKRKYYPDSKSYGHDYMGVRYKFLSTPNQLVRKIDHMLKKQPSEGTVKINIDVSFHAKTLSGVNGAVARDNHVNFIAAATWELPL